MEPDPNADAGDLSPTGTGPASNTKTRKRTKTGCLTCRRRRIKCGEERPVCANCTKSKRQCEGYNQRVIFKPPMGNWPDHSGVVSTLQYHNSSLPGSKVPSQPQDDGNVASIQPRPLSRFEYAADDGPPVGHINTQQAYVGGTRPYHPTPGYQQPLASPHHQIPTSVSATSHYPHPSPVHPGFPAQYDAAPSYPDQASFTNVPYTQAPQQQAYYQQERAYAPQPGVPSQNDNYPARFHEPRSPHYLYDGRGQTMEYRGAYTMPSGASNAGPPHSNFQSSHMPQHATSDVKHMHGAYGMSRV